MAGSGTITRKDIITDEALEWGKKYQEEVTKAIEANAELIQSAKDLAKVANAYRKAKNNDEFIQLKNEERLATVKAIEAIKQEEAAVISIEKQKRAKLQTEKSEISTTNTRERSIRNSTKAGLAEKLQLQETRRELNLQAKASGVLTSQYDKLNAQRTIAQKRLANLLAAEKAERNEIIKAKNEFDALDKKIKAIDATTKNYTKNVGNYQSAFKGLGNTLRQLVSAFGVTSGLILFVNSLKDGLKIMRDFEKSNATLAAVLRQSKDQTKALKDEAIRLGESTVETAQEVTDLQIAYARLGFAQQQIIDLTESTIQGAISMNSKLDETAELVGAVVQSYDELSSTDAPEIIDILSLSTASSALNFQKLQTALPTVLAPANALGVSFTKVVATLGKLADAQIDISTGATSLKNIFIEASKRGIDYEVALEEIRNSTDKLKTANEIFGKRTAVSALVIANNTEKVNELDESLQHAAGTSEEMSNKELDTLDGSLKLLNSAWEGYILRLDEANGSSASLKDITKFLAENLSTILDIVTSAVKAWLAYRAILIAVNTIKKLATAYTIAYRIAMVALNRGIASTIKSMKLFRIALSKTGIGLAVVAITALVYAFSKMKKSIDLVGKVQSQAAKETAEQTSKIQQLIKVAKDDNVSKENRIKAIKELNKISPEYLGNLTLENINTKEGTKLVNDYIKAVKALALEKAIASKRESLMGELAEKELKSIEDFKTSAEKLGDSTVGALFDSIFGKNELNVKNREELEKYIKTLKVSDELAQSLRDGYEPYLKAKEEDVKKTQDQIDALDEYTKTKLASGELTIGGNGGNEDIESTEKALKKLRGELNVLKSSLNSLVKDGYESLTVAQANDVVETRKAIKAKQDEIDAILGTTKASKDHISVLKDQAQQEYELAQFRLEYAKSLNEDIYKNDKNSLDERLDALHDAGQLEQAIAKETAEFKLKEISRYDSTIRDLSDSEIETLVNGGEIQKKLRNDEILVLEQYFADKKRLEKKSEESTKEVIDSQVAIFNTGLQKQIDADEIALNNRITNENKIYKANLDNARGNQ